MPVKDQPNTAAGTGAKVRAQGKADEKTRVEAEANAEAAAQAEAEARAKVEANAARISVAVIGGGIAGITAAVKLYQQGFRVTLFEKDQELGGNMSSRSLDDKRDPKDVYPHIFADWYKEFWYLLEHDLKMPRDEYFARQDTIRMASLPDDKGPKPTQFTADQFATLAAPTSIANVVANTRSGVLSARDMLLFAQATLDLVGTPAESKRSKMLNDLDLTGYLYARPYMNDEIAGFQDDILKIIWSMPSDQTSAIAYQKLVRHTMTFPAGTPFAWLLKGPLQQALMAPIRRKLEAALPETGGELRLNTEVYALELDARAEGKKHLDQFIKVRSKNEGVEREEDFRYAVIATPAKVASELALNSTLAERHPTLARLREADTARIPVIYLYFKKPFRDAHAADLKNLPTDLTGFKRRTKPSKKSRRTNNYDITMINIGSLWEEEHLKRNVLYPGAAAADEVEKGEPVLVLAASHATAIEFRGPDDESFRGTARSQGFAILERFKDYFPFVEIGERWGDNKADIDWSRTRLVNNASHQLFLNDVGSNEWRPYASLKNYQDRLAGDQEIDPNEVVDYCKNVFFAGDYCMTDVDMATVEAATQSGVLAAQALLAEAGAEGQLVPLQPHDIYTTDALILAKLATAPAAYASALAATYEAAAQDPIRALTFPLSTAVLATAYLADWLRSLEQLVRFQIPGYRGSNQNAGGHHFGEDRHAGILQWGANLAVAAVAEGPKLAPALAETAAEGVYSMWRGTVGRALFPNMRKTLRDPTHPHRPHARAAPPRGGPPRTWGDLAREALGDRPVTAQSLSDGAFGMATTLLRTVKPLPAAAAAGAMPADAGRWAAAFQQGVAAVKARADSYRHYDTPFELPD